MVRPVRPTRILAPGGSFICPNTMCRLVDNAGLHHFVVQVVALTGTLAYAGEYGISAVLGGNVSDQLLDQYGFSYSGTAEQTDLTALLDTGRAGRRP